MWEVLFNQFSNLYLIRLKYIDLILPDKIGCEWLIIEMSYQIWTIHTMLCDCVDGHSI